MLRQPHVLQIILHDLGRQLSCYQQGSVRSPAIDRMASEGVLFRNHFSTGAVCVPSRCSILTGQYPHTHKLWRCSPDAAALPALLRKAGYHTVRVGFREEEEFFPDSAEINLAEFAKETLGYSRTWSDSEDSHALAHAACNILDSHDPHKPIYMCIAFSDVHRPNDMKVNVDEITATTLPAYLPQLPDTIESKRDFAKLEKQILYADAAVGYILDRIRAGGYHENTLVILTTDHGIDYPKAKMTLYDAGIEAALIFWGCGCRAGTCDNNLHSHMDILPTLLDCLNLPPEPTAQGVSFAAALQGSAHYRSRKEIYAQRGWETAQNRCCALRTTQYKYIVHEQAGNTIPIPPAYRKAVGADIVDKIYNIPLAQCELYDLWNDPYELVNRIDDSELQPIKSQLCCRLSEILQQAERGDPYGN